MPAYDPSEMETGEHRLHTVEPKQAPSSLFEVDFGAVSDRGKVRTNNEDHYDGIVAHVGDSRAYLFRRGELHQLTRDQTQAQMLLEAGVIIRRSRKYSVAIRRLRKRVSPFWSWRSRPEVATTSPPCWAT